MQQIVDWLKELSMSEYAERFAGNDIDMAALPDMTDNISKRAFRPGAPELTSSSEPCVDGTRL